MVPSASFMMGVMRAVAHRAPFVAALVFTFTSGVALVFTSGVALIVAFVFTLGVMNIVPAGV
ncbi:hypothetical protein [Sorangium sp. So ce854]|uniref:hypothetical protein n=1 Tax=Sorangium sp. So ce854 TaxID=3133322 RepID=UPI003F645883